MTKRPDVPDRIPYQEIIDYAIERASNDGDHTIILGKAFPNGPEFDAIGEYCRKNGCSLTHGKSTRSLRVLRNQ